MQKCKCTNKSIYMKRTILVTILTLILSGQAWAFLPASASRPLHRVNAHWYKGNNYLEVQEQYAKNSEMWDAVLAWITAGNIHYMKPGKYYVYVGSDSVRVTIQEAETRDSSKIEAHVQYIDLQWTMRGTEVYEKYDLEDVEPINDYNPKKDVQHFREKTDAKSVRRMRKSHQVIVSDPNTVYLFFPGEPHKALLKNGTAEPIRKVVAKIPYIRG